jgi:hypothetical protein
MSGEMIGLESVKQRFLAVLEREYAKYPWAKEHPERLLAMRASSVATLNGERQCLIDGLAWQTAWWEVGMKGKPTYKGIHALSGKAV